MDKEKIGNWLANLTFISFGAIISVYLLSTFINRKITPEEMFISGIGLIIGLTVMFIGFYSIYLQLVGKSELESLYLPKTVGFVFFSVGIIYFYFFSIIGFFFLIIGFFLLFFSFRQIYLKRTGRREWINGINYPVDFSGHLEEQNLSSNNNKIQNNDLFQNFSGENFKD